VNLFNKDIGMPAIAKAKKPFKKNVLRAMSMLGAERDNTIFIGDQILTDVLAAHNAGIRAILVPPINDRRGPFTKFKRLLERPFIKKYEKRAGK
jgi:predicted HAD superfamily phosphohydrolase YqeG